MLLVENSLIEHGLGWDELYIFFHPSLVWFNNSIFNLGLDYFDISLQSWTFEVHYQIMSRQLDGQFLLIFLGKREILQQFLKGRVLFWTSNTIQ